KAPQLFERIILVNPASSYNHRPWIHWGCHLSHWLPEFFYQFASIAFLPFLASLERLSLEDRQAVLEAVRSVPQKTSVWRLSLLRQFEVDEQQLHQLSQPVLLIASQADRLLPSVAEAQQLARSFRNAQTVILPHSGHACLLEAEINLCQIMQSAGFLERMPHPTSKSEGAVLNDG
ncbi:MAG TPA: alpha/beta hydrolase, partial [Candidatus Caenarcaniphilales bacterium]